MPTWLTTAIFVPLIASPRTAPRAVTRVRAALWAVLLACAACSPSPPAGDAGADAGEPDAGVDAGGAPVLLASGQRYLGPGFAAEGGFVYWVADLGGQTQVFRVATSGGQVASLTPGLSGIHGLAVDGTTLWWGDLQHLLSLPAAGGAAVQRAPATINSIAAQGGEVFWTSGAGEVLRWRAADGVVRIAAQQDDPQQLVLDATGVFWSEFGVVAGVSKVHRAPRDGGSDLVLATGRDGDRQLAVHDGWLYFTHAPQGSVGAPELWRTPIAQAAPMRFSDHSPRALAVDSTGVYWAEGDAELRVVRTDHDGGSLSTVATLADAGAAVGLALDDANVSWATAQAVWTIRK